MKIGILTQPLGLNYGGILQNYALQTVLKRMGHEVWTLDVGKYRWRDWLDNAWRVLAHKLLGHNVGFALTPLQRNQLEVPLRRFVTTHIQLTAPRKNWFSRDMISKYQLDTLLVGSDQTWRPQYNKHVEDLYLQFAQGAKVHRIAYAASFGTDEWEYTDTQTAVCAALAKQFGAISVREQSGVKLCTEKLGVKVEHVLDPTMLLTADDYKELCKQIPVRDPFVFAYILDADEKKMIEIQRFADSKQLPCVIMQANESITPDDSVEKWLSHFRDAAFVITDSFHGSVFSILFQKDLFVYKNKGRGASRFDSLFSMLKLENRYITGPVENKEPVNWNEVSKQLVHLREHSSQWLQSNLTNNK